MVSVHGKQAIQDGIFLVTLLFFANTSQYRFQNKYINFYMDLMYMDKKYKEKSIWK